MNYYIVTNVPILKRKNRKSIKISLEEILNFDNRIYSGYEEYKDIDIDFESVFNLKLIKKNGELSNLSIEFMRYAREARNMLLLSVLDRWIDEHNLKIEVYFKDLQSMKSIY